MIQEQFPLRASLRTAFALTRNQGDVLACPAFGYTSTIDTIQQRAGHNVAHSPRFLWWNLRGSGKEIEDAAAAVERSGLCLESLCPYDVSKLGESPSYAALQDAKTRVPKGLKLWGIHGVEGVKRAICQGSAVVFKMANMDGTEHISCIDGYTEFGVEVWDSIGQALTMPWADIESGGRIKLLYRLVGLPLTPVAGYIEGDAPTLIDGVLSLPKLMLWIGFDKEPKSINGKDVKFQIIDQGSVSYDNEDVRDIVFWHSGQFTLFVPKLLIDGVLRYGVKMVRPTATFISGEQI